MLSCNDDKSSFNLLWITSRITTKLYFLVIGNKSVRLKLERRFTKED